MDTITPHWTSLPKDLLALIAKCLHTRIDILRFRAVCNSFRCSFPLPPKTLSFKIPIFHNSSHITLLREDTVYAIEPLIKICNTHITTETWLLRVEESIPGQVLLKDTLHGYSYKNMSHKLPCSLNLLDYCIKEISKVYSLKLVPAGLGEDRASEINCFDKVVVSSCLDEIDHEFAVMGLSDGNVLVWRSGDERFTEVGVDDFDDIIYHNGKFYASGICTSMSIMGQTLSVDSKSLEIKEIATPPWQSNTFARYLVKSCNDLYLIDETHHKMHLDVFKLYEEKNKWVQVMNEFENNVLFLGDDCSFYLSAKEFKGCKGNCVYLIKERFSKVKEDYPGSDVKNYDLEDDTIVPLSGHSNIFWPPPTWLKQNTNSA